MAREYIDAAPFREWIERRLPLYEDHEDFAARCGTTSRTVYRYRMGLDGNGDPTDTVMRSVVEDILEAEGSAMFWELYPTLADDLPELRPEEFCYTCRAFVHPLANDRCPWCESPMLRPDVSKLPQRERNEVDTAPTLVVRYKPRRVGAKPFLFDHLMEERRLALEVFVVTKSFRPAGASVAHQFSNSQDSAASSLRDLVIREGWYKPPSRRSPILYARAANAAARRIKAALRDGTWDRVAPERESRMRHRVFDEATLHEALWLYHGEGVGIDTVARRLLRRCDTTHVGSVKHALLDEFERRGWPKRTHRAASDQRKGQWIVPPDDRRCQHPGGCMRYASAAGGLCLDHDPDRVEERVAMATKASLAANHDAIDAEPFRLWLLTRLQRDGLSLVAFAKLVPVGYDRLSDLRARRATVIRRRTIDKICDALGDVTFEDIYLPVEDDAEAA